MKIQQSDAASHFLKGTVQTIPEVGIRIHSSFWGSIFIALVLLLWVLFIARLAAAQNPFPKMSRPSLRTESHEPCWESLSPSLTEDQIKTFEGLRRAYMAEARPIRTELFALRVQLRYLLSDPSVQLRTLLGQQRKISSLQTRLDEVSLAYQIKVRSVLTKEQLEGLRQGWPYEMDWEHEIPFPATGIRSKKGLQ